MIMRKLIIPLLLLSLTSLHAERVQWYTPPRTDYTTQSGTLFSSTAYEVLSDDYPMGSMIALTAGDATSIVTVTGSLPELPAGRDIAATEAVMKELNASESGVAQVSVSVIRSGSIAKPEGSGWYSLYLGSFPADEAYQIYQRLERNGIQAYADIEGEEVSLTVRYVMGFRLDAVKEKLLMLGAEGAEMPEKNPYL